MPAVSPAILVDTTLDAIQQSGGAAAYVSDNVRTHPRRFVVQYQDQTFSLWVYIWTLTYGGRSSLPREYRIQMTSVASPLSLNTDGYTVLSGFYPDLGIFAGFDIERHRTFAEGSPSVQISLDTIHNALQDGLAFATKENQEIAVAIRPDQFLSYVLHAEMLHRFGGEAPVLSLLTKAARTEEIAQQEIDALTVERRRIVTQVSRYARAAHFRRQVLSAYENRCAVTRAQLKLVDAAHILPAQAEGSTDHISNGLALSPTMHRAYDNGLIYLNEDCCMMLHSRKTKELEIQNLHAGINQLTEHMNTRIHLPANRSLWPNPKFIQMANRYRRIEGY